MYVYPGTRNTNSTENSKMVSTHPLQTQKFLRRFKYVTHTSFACSAGPSSNIWWGRVTTTTRPMRVEERQLVRISTRTNDIAQPRVLFYHWFSHIFGAIQKSGQTTNRNSLALRERGATTNQRQRGQENLKAKQPSAKMLNESTCRMLPVSTGKSSKMSKCPTTMPDHL